MLARLSRRIAPFVPFGGGEIAIAHDFRPPPYGGSNQFLLALRGELARRGYRTSASRLTGRTRGCLLNAFLFDDRMLRRADRERVRVVQRVDGPVGVYRGYDDGTDRRVAELNERYADATIFQSRYSLEATRALGLELRNPTVIHNAVDPEIFHPGAGRKEGDRIRLVATSWSDNPNKGFDWYEWLDEHLDFDRFELVFVGRSPVPFRRIRHVPPLDSAGLADLLRRQDVFVTASRHESCSNALLEALACGLPAVYLRSGSNAELVREAGAGFSSHEELLDAIESVAARRDELRRAIDIPSLAAVADDYLAAMGLPPRPE